MVNKSSILWVHVLPFSILFLSFNSSSAIWTLHYLSVAILSVIIFFKVANSLFLKKTTLKVFFMLCSWLLFPFGLGFLYMDDALNYKYILIVLFYSVIAVYYSVFIFGGDDINYKFIKFISYSYALVNGVLLLLFWAGYNLVESQNPYQFSGVFANRNLLAVTGLYVLIISVVFPLYFQSVFNKGLLISLSILILSTASSKGIVGLFIIYSFLFLQLRVNISEFLIYFLLFVSFVFLGFYFGAFDRFIDRLFVDEGFQSNRSNLERLELMVLALHTISDNLFSGIGLQNSQYYLISSFRDSGTYSHNNYLEVFLSSGFFGFVFYLAPVVYLIWKLMFSHHGLKALLIFMLVMKFALDLAMVSYFLFNSIFFYSIIFVLFFKYKDQAYGKNTLYRQHA